MTDKLTEQAWLDLTIVEAGEIKNFYQNVVGWQAEEVSMGDYSDYSMNSPTTGEPVAGICHAKGVNKALPAMWLPYFLVEDVNQALSKVLALGGEQMGEVKTMGKDCYAVIKDPAGACCALYQKG